MSQPSPATTEKLLLIHGTFAASLDDQGKGWWQRGSSVWDDLARRLPSNVSLPTDEEELFHWSGANTEWEREKACNLLFQQLLAYEADEQPYHLVGHSHGGSVIWNALVRATQAGVELRHLRSWATVGTPFLQFGSQPGVRKTEIWLLVAALALCIVAFFFLTLLQVLVLGGIWYFWGLTTPRMPIMFWTAANFSAAYTFAAPALLLRKVSIKGRAALATRAPCELTTMSRYGDRWLGIASTQDEAINGLVHTVGFQAPFVPELRLSDETKFGRFDESETATIFNLIKRIQQTYLQWFNGLVPKINRLISAHVRGYFQGNDWAGTCVTSVTVGPLPAKPEAYPYLDERVDRAITAEANRLLIGQLSGLVPTLREGFAQMVIGQGGVLVQLPPEIQQVVMSEKLLVHALYFDNADARQLLCLHVAEHAQRNLPGLESPWSDALFQWYRRFKDAVRLHLLNGLA